VLNVLTIDVEDYFHVTAFEYKISKKQWDYLPSRVECNILRLLEILDLYRTKATFFVLGWVAKKNPKLVKEIYNNGHEIACHGNTHKLVYESTPESFRKDVKDARSVIEDSIGNRVHGFRATSFSFVKETLWALDILIEEGYLYDSSIFPIYHDRYGIPDWYRFPHYISRNGGGIHEIPPSTLRILGNNIPIAGGAYLRFLPLILIDWGIKKINTNESKPAVLYIHPWELDSKQPLIKSSMITAFRHYSRINSVERKFKRLLEKYSFGPALKIITKEKNI
jgi:polysaccharide deacetylase family protein (PEP-CTERM system associated)